MPKSYSWLTNQSPATWSVDFVTTRMILESGFALLFVLLPLLAKKGITNTIG